MHDKQKGDCPKVLFKYVGFPIKNPKYWHHQKPAICLTYSDKRLHFRSQTHNSYGHYMW